VTGVALARWLGAAAIVIAVWLALDLLLLLFAGVLLAIFLRTLSGWVSSRLRVGRGFGLLIVIVVLLGGMALMGAFYAPTIAEQGDELAERLPQVGSDLASRVRAYSWGRWLLGELSENAPAGQAVVQRASRAAGTLLHALTAVAVVLFVGLYFAVEPGPYVRGALRLFPPARRRRIAEALYACHHVLRAWLFGQALAMLIVGSAMGIGLSIIGVPFPLLLGVLAGVFEFVPVIGPVIAVFPALMLATAEGGRQMLYVLALYGVLQSAESYVITPLVQRRVVELPPVMTITAQLALGWMAGPLGLLVAVPLMAAVMVLVQLLYVTDILKDRVDPELERTGKEAVDREARGPLKGVLPREG
jgi:predicted PurR-regulated permease PerM